MKSREFFKQSSARAFTMVELLIAVSIMVLVASALAVSLRPAAGKRFLEQNYRNMLSEMKTAQLKALSNVANPAAPTGTKYNYVGFKITNNAQGVGTYTTFRSNTNTNCPDSIATYDSQGTLLGGAPFEMGLTITKGCFYFKMGSGEINYVTSAANNNCQNLASTRYDEACKFGVGSYIVGVSTVCMTIATNDIGLIAYGGTNCPGTAAAGGPPTP